MSDSQSFIDRLRSLADDVDSQEKLLDTKKTELKNLMDEEESLEEHLDNIGSDCDPSAYIDGVHIDDLSDGEGASHSALSEVLEQKIWQTRREERDLRKEIKGLRGRFLEELKKLLNFVLDPSKVGNAKHDELGGKTPAAVWECFITALLQVDDTCNDSVEHVGGANDVGIDILLRDIRAGTNTQVVQVKRGKFLSSGKGNAIVLQLVGSMVYYGVKKGALYCSEKRSVLTDHTKKVMKAFEEKGYTIRVFCKEDIELLLEYASRKCSYFIDQLIDSLKEAD